MAYLDFLSSLHKATKRDYIGRVNEYPKAEAIKKAKPYGFDYWDGDRKFGYGGYRYDGRWRPVDIHWQDRAGDLLKGFEVRHQPRWRFPELSAWTPLWRPQDANCCGEGGDAGLDFDIVDDRLTLTSVNMRRAGEGV